MGFPTANLGGVETLIPGDGVYAVLAHVHGTAWPAAANIGPNPTFGETATRWKFISSTSTAISMANR